MGPIPSLRVMVVGPTPEDAIDVALPAHVPLTPAATVCDNTPHTAQLDASVANSSALAPAPTNAIPLSFLIAPLPSYTWYNTSVIWSR